MSSRRLRALENERLTGRVPQQLGDTKEEEKEDTKEEEAEEEPVVQKKKPVNPFLALGFGLGSSDEEEREESSSKGKEAEEDATGGASSTSASSKSKKKKNKKKNNKGKDGSEKASAAREIDEVEEAIREVQLKFGETPTTGAYASIPQVFPLDASTAPRQTMGLLTVERKLLNAETEMKRRFGSSVVRADSGAEVRANRARGIMKRTTITYPKATWPRLARAGLVMIVDVGRECKGNETWFKVQHSPQYQEVQMRFLAAVQSMDPQNISAILRAHPNHIDSLLQLSEVCKMSGDLQLAADFIERAIYIFECAFHPLFNPALGTCRLHYSVFENRSLFLSLFRHIGFVGGRGCWRTGLELCKFLLSLDPDEDPLGVQLMIDYYALRAGEYRYLQKMHAEWGSARQLAWLPNFAYSAALAEFYICQEQGGSLEAANVLIQTALVRFPEVITLIADKCGASLHPDVVSSALFAVSTSPNLSERCVRQLCVLYVERCHSLWKPADVLQWVQDNALALVKRNAATDEEIVAAAKRRKTHYPGTPLNIQRHTIISEIEPAIALLPAEVALQAVLAYDPLPPPNSVSPYDGRAIAAPQGEYAGSTLGAFFRSLIPGWAEAAIPQPPRAPHEGAAQMPPDFEVGDLRERLLGFASHLGLDRLAGMFNRGADEQGEEDAILDQLQAEEIAAALAAGHHPYDEEEEEEDN